MKPIVVLLILTLALVAQGQTGPSSIKGVVEDLNGIPIADATVYGVDPNNVKKRITTRGDSQGKFKFTDVTPGTYELRAYKESDGYADTFFGFFDVGNTRSSRIVQVTATGDVSDVVLRLGPKYARLRLTIIDENGVSVDGALWFIKGSGTKRVYGVGVAANAEVLVPPVAFEFEIEKKGYALWRSKLLLPKSDETIRVRAHLQPTKL